MDMLMPEQDGPDGPGWTGKNWTGRYVIWSCEDNAPVTRGTQAAIRRTLLGQDMLPAEVDRLFVLADKEGSSNPLPEGRWGTKITTRLAPDAVMGDVTTGLLRREDFVEFCALWFRRTWTRRGRMNRAISLSLMLSLPNDPFEDI
jgi:hypothetical protein